MKKEKMRVNKYLALCGLGARRKVEQYITGRRVTINGVIVTDLSYQVDPDTDIVVVDRKKVTPIGRYYYLMLNKPKGYITTLDDIENRPVVMDLLPQKYRETGVFPVGRLDRDTEGLLLLTNDGELSYRLTHPKFGVPKEYVVELDRPLEFKDKIKIEKGIRLYGTRTNPAVILPLSKNGTVVKITITEGKKRQVRLTFQYSGYKVKKLKRTAFGPVKLTGVNSGDFRTLKEKEVKSLKALFKQTEPAQ